jgi:hypothetical protein
MYRRCSDGRAQRTERSSGRIGELADARLCRYGLLALVISCRPAPLLSHFNMYGVTSVDAAPTTRRGLRCDGPLKKLNMRRSSTCVCMHMNMDMAAGFSFPDRRHYFYSGVYPGVWRRSTWSVRGRHTKMNWTPDFHFLQHTSVANI